jgi:nicotinate-nucleotide pyrophosphorylase (carboxylating)
MDDILYFLKEDFKEIGDITSDTLFSNETGEGIIFNKSDCILAGLSEAKEVFKQTGAKLKSLKKDGVPLAKNTNIATVSGSLRSILSGERLALNILGRMSGIATTTKKLIDICQPFNKSIQIAATRKTTPGFRKYEKKAVVIGGGITHRMGLYDAILIKDNHLKALGSVKKAIEIVRIKNNHIPIEIEVENEEDALIAAKYSVNIIMLDNFPPSKAKRLAGKIKKLNPSIKIEISGGINFENIHKYAPFSDIISVGMLTHSIKNVDFSLEIY